jgi:hypothetical protein
MPYDSPSGRPRFPHLLGLPPSSGNIRATDHQRGYCVATARSRSSHLRAEPRFQAKREAGLNAITDCCGWQLFPQHDGRFCSRLYTLDRTPVGRYAVADHERRAARSIAAKCKHVQDLIAVHIDEADRLAVEAVIRHGRRECATATLIHEGNSWPIAAGKSDVLQPVAVQVCNEDSGREE